MDIIRDILPLKNTMYRLALRITLNSQEAEDVVQDVVIKMWNNRENLESVDNLEAYAMRMARNLALDRQRMKVNQSEDIDAVGEMPQAVDDAMERREQVESVRMMMRQLPEKQRTVMQLRDFEGYSYKEIAQMMDVTEDQVKVSLFRARQYVKSRLTSFNA